MLHYHHYTESIALISFNYSVGLNVFILQMRTVECTWLKLKTRTLNYTSNLNKLNQNCVYHVFISFTCVYFTSILD